MNVMHILLYTLFLKIAVSRTRYHLAVRLQFTERYSEKSTRVHGVTTQ
jgi:hypothetical protein